MKMISPPHEAVGIINRIRKNGPYIEIWMTGRVEWHQRCKARQLESIVNRSGLTDRVLNLGLAGLQIGWAWRDDCTLDPVSLQEPAMAAASVSVQFVRKSRRDTPWDSVPDLNDRSIRQENERPGAGSSSHWGPPAGMPDETMLFRREIRTTDYLVTAL